MRLTLLALGVCLAAGSLGAQEVLRVPNTPQCKQCVLQLEEVVRLGGNSSREPLLTRHSTALRLSSGHWVVAPVAEPGVLSLYDPSGRFVRTVGRLGDGPGEYQLPSLLRVLTGDSLLVVDWRSFRISILDPSLRFVRSMLVPAQVYDIVEDASGDLIVQVHMAATGRAGMPLQLYRRNGVHVRSFGAERPRWDRRKEMEVIRVLASPDSHLVWSSYRNRYRLELWRTDGSLQKRLERDVDWFAPWDVQVGTARTHRPPSYLQAIQADSAGRLWVQIAVAAAGWKPIAIPYAKDGREPVLSLEEFDQQFDTVIDVLDPASGKLLASRRFAPRLWGVVGPNLYVQRIETPAGEIRLVILKASLTNPS